MRTRAVPILLAIIIISPLPVLAFTKIESMPYSIVNRDGATIYWNESYRITIDDMEIRMVLGPAHTTYGGQPLVINWDPEIVSVIVEGEDVMRREAFGSGVENDPISNMPFLGIGGLVSPQNLLTGTEPIDVPQITFDWVNEGGDGMVSWATSYQYQPGDRILWLNRTYVLNATLDVECQYRLASEYQAIQQTITVTNGETEQYLPFPLESAFSLGSKLVERGINLPEMMLEPDRYLTYPAETPPAHWYNDSLGGYEIPPAMWEEEVLPGMLYVEFDLEGERDWYGVSTNTTLTFELLSGVGIKVLSTDGMDGLRPYCIFFSGPGDHVLMGFKPFEEAGPYGDFAPMKLGAGREVSLEILWFFPEPVDGEMSPSILGDFGKSAISVSEFHSLHGQAGSLFESANQLAREGKITEAIEKANQSIEVLKPLGELSSAVEEEARTINATINTWHSASTEPTRHSEREGRPAMIYSILVIVVLILAMAAYIYLVEPRLSSAEE